MPNTLPTRDLSPNPFQAPALASTPPRIRDAPQRGTGANGVWHTTVSEMLPLPSAGPCNSATVVVCPPLHHRARAATPLLTPVISETLEPACHTPVAHRQHSCVCRCITVQHALPIAWPSQPSGSYKRPARHRSAP